jgi:hypothetical protein
MEFFCFKPQRASLWFQFRDSSNDHAKKMLGFTRFLPAGSDAFQKFFFGNCIVGFYVIRSNACCSANELTNQTIRYRVLWNGPCKVNNGFAESGRALLQIVDALCVRIFADNSRTIVPKRILGVHISLFGFRHYFVIRHSGFVIAFHSFVISASSLLPLMR